MLDRVRSANDALIAAGVLPAGIDQSRVTVEPPRDPAHGDMATNAAMVLAKDAGKKPRELAEAIAEKLRADDLVAKVDVAGPGFINLTLKPAAWIEALAQRGAARVRNTAAATSAAACRSMSNMSRPIRPGRCMSAIAAAPCSATRWPICWPSPASRSRANITSTMPARRSMLLARSAYLRYREALGEDIGAIPEGLYPGDYLKPVGAALAAEYGDTLKAQPEAQWLPVVRAKAIDDDDGGDPRRPRRAQHQPRVFFSERSLIAGGARSTWPRRSNGCAQRGYVYEGRLPPPKGAPVEDWEDREQTLFRSTQFGDDIDRPLKKSDGSYTYFASDIAYHRSKLERGFRALIDVWGADHGGYIKRMQAAVAALSDRKAELDVKVVQLVKLLRAGEPVKMSKRAGEFVTLREVVDEVGRDAVRFMMLFRKNDAVLEFDLAKVIEQSRDNPVFYVQYGHARAQSVFRNARAAFPDLPADLHATVGCATWRGCRTRRNSR